MSRSLFLLAATSCVLTGCNLLNKQEPQYDDARNPFYKQAQQDLDNNDAAKAATDYEQALAADPKLAGAHYQLGIIDSEKLSDPVSAIYHFRRYLELAPNSDQADKVKGLIDKESQAFAATLPSTGNSDELTKAQADNAALKKQVDDATQTIVQLQAQLAKSKHHHEVAAAAATAPPPPAPAPMVADNSTPAPVSAPAPAADPTASPTTNAAPAGPQKALPLDAPNPALDAATGTNAAASSGPSRSYTVVKGDSLWKIAHKMYPGDTKNGVDKLQEANKDAIGGKPLKIGQVLVVPQ